MTDYSAEELIPKVGETQTEEKKSGLTEDIKEYKSHSNNLTKAQLFDQVYQQEQWTYLQEHGHIMDSAYKKRLKGKLITMISKGDIYINEVGKLIVRKGTNKTQAKKKKRK